MTEEDVVRSEFLVQVRDCLGEKFDGSVTREELDRFVREVANAMDQISIHNVDEMDSWKLQVFGTPYFFRTSGFAKEQALIFAASVAAAMGASFNITSAVVSQVIPALHRVRHLTEVECEVFRRIRSAGEGTSDAVVDLEEVRRLWPDDPALLELTVSELAKKHIIEMIGSDNARIIR